VKYTRSFGESEQTHFPAVGLEERQEGANADWLILPRLRPGLRASSPQKPESLVVLRPDR